MSFLMSVLMFVVVFTVLVFVHELGHFWVARRNRVRVDVFSIGFGREVYGWTDRHETRWKIGWIPLGGYVKFFGDESVASTAGAGLARMSDTDKAVSFHHKRLGQRMAIVAAGPIANLVFAILVLTVLFVSVGQPYLAAKVGLVQPHSAAAAAGFQVDDVITGIDGRKIARFEDIQDIVRHAAGRKLAFSIERHGQPMVIQGTPQQVLARDNFGKEHKIGRLGIAAAGLEIIERGPLEAVVAATGETVHLMGQILGYLGQMIVGLRSAEELGGPLLIAQLSGQAAQAGVASLVNFMALLSINLGLINLFPIPMLDGGHLLFYVVEAIRGRPLGERVQEYGFRIGLAAVLTLTIFVTWQDLERLQVFEFLSNLL